MDKSVPVHSLVFKKWLNHAKMIRRNNKSDCLKHKNNPNLSDLVNLNGLEKPGEGVLKVELGARADKLATLGESMSDFAGRVEDHEDVQAGEVAGLVEGLKKAMQNELSPKKAAELLVILKRRFFKKSYFGFLKKKKAYKSAEGIKWEDVQKKLEDSPGKLWSLQQMEETGGEPDIMGYDKKTGEYIFIDCSAESPKGRRNCVYDREGEVELKKRDPSANYKSNAVSMAALMGVDILNEKEYRELQTKGEFDKNSWSWIKTPVDKRKTGVALYWARVVDVVHVYEGIPSGHFDRRAWRGGLRI